MAKVIEVDGSEREIGDSPSLEEMQAAVGGLIQYVPLPDTTENFLYVNEEGLIHGLEYNSKASRLAGQPLVGPAIFMREDEDG